MYISAGIHDMEHFLRWQRHNFYIINESMVYENNMMSMLLLRTRQSFPAVLRIWIRIRKDPHHLAGSGSASGILDA
jgi:hypothetical protein